MFGGVLYLILDILSWSSTYSIIAIGLSLLLGLKGFLNFAHGAFFMVGAFLYLTLYPIIGFFPTLLVVFIILGIGGIALNIGLAEPLKERHAVTHLIATAGLAMMIRQIIKIIFAGYTFYCPMPSFGKGSLNLFSISYSSYRIFIIGSTISVFMAVYLYLKGTKMGLLLRATTFDRNISKTLGINPFKVDNVAFFIACGLAGLAGCIISPISGAHFRMGQEFMLMVFLIVIVGGLGTIKGVLITGLIMGGIRAFVSQLISPWIAHIIMLIFLVAVLIRTKYGLFGVPGVLKH